MSLFRSEEMSCQQVILQIDVGYNIVVGMGKLGLVQFKDVNPNESVCQRKYYPEVKRCHSVERQIAFFSKELSQRNMSIKNVEDDVEMPQARELLIIESKLNEMEELYQQQAASAESLIESHAQLIEKKQVFTKMQNILNEFDQQPVVPRAYSNIDEEAHLLERDIELQELNMSNISFVSGVILRRQVSMMQTMIWRLCRSAIFRHKEITGPITDSDAGRFVLKNAFFILCYGEQTKNRVTQICESCRAHLVDCPKNENERRVLLHDILGRIQDLDIVIKRTEENQQEFLVEISKNVHKWSVQIRRMKSVFAVLNLFNYNIGQNCLICEYWCPSVSLQSVQNTIFCESAKLSTVPPLFQHSNTNHTPPTFFKTNKFTQSFQDIINAYGVPNYSEMNPTVFTIITFPFFFAVMFGDAGHGFLMTLFAVWLVHIGKPNKLLTRLIISEIAETIVDGRYIILLMGLFSIYTGLIYNDVFSKSVHMAFLGSRWQVSRDVLANLTNITSMEMYQMDPTGNRDFIGTPYPFGLDPVWQFSTNKLLLQNSYKMKVSIIFGVFHMTCGIFMSFFNFCYFKQRLSVVFEFLPKLVFFWSIFGYLVVLIFMKWSMYDASDSACAPSLLVMFINMFLFNYPTEPCYLVPMFNLQPQIQCFLVVLAFICILSMWFGEIIFLYWKQHGRRSQFLSSFLKRGRANGGGDEIGEMSPLLSHQEDNESEAPIWADILLEKSINTIEFCLGTISHTASYLRLWALSLAHAQLSEVLWNMVFRHGIQRSGWWGSILTTILFPAWAFLTVSVLLVMEGFSAFLHSLRLHWLEFQSKFYKGSGLAFTPFSLLTFEDEMQDN